MVAEELVSLALRDSSLSVPPPGKERPLSLVKALGLSFPYDWSNRGGISDDALIINVLKRGIFEDICRICAYYSIEKVDGLSVVAFKDAPSLIYPRMIANIRKGFALND